MKLSFPLFISFFAFSCGNPAREEKNRMTEDKDSSTTKEMDSSFSDENATELKRILEENDLSDSVKIVEEAHLNNPKSLIPEKVEKYYYFPGGMKTEIEPAFDQFYIVFNYNQEMKKLNETEVAENKIRFDNDLKELGLVRLSNRQNMYQMVQSKYSRKQLIEKLISKTEAQQLEATYSSRYINRYFQRGFTVEFKNGIEEKEIKQLFTKFGLKDFIISGGDSKQFNAFINFTTREMLSYHFLIVADFLSNQNIVEKIYTESIQNALPD